MLSYQQLQSLDPRIIKILEQVITLSPEKRKEVVDLFNQLLQIVNESNQAKDKNKIWVESDLYLYGTVVKIGGAREPSITIITDNGRVIEIECKKEQLSKLNQNVIYQYKGIRVKAKEEINTGEIKNVEFIELVDYNPSFDENVLNELIEKGTEAWKGIEDPVAWVRSLRDA